MQRNGEKQKEGEISNHNNNFEQRKRTEASRHAHGMDRDRIEDGWFTEGNALWPGQRLSLQVEEVLHREKSDYQDILVFQSKNHGRVLVLDGVIQCTEHDEFSYQEMITFLPLCAHPRPRSVLIVGGGDGGVAREVAKHPHVESITQVEIDGAVVAASKNHLPTLSTGFNSHKLTLNICDGFEYMKRHQDTFDVIITDSSDPIGPAENLFTADYFALLKGALKRGGVICSQAGCAWIGLDHLKQTVGHCRTHFSNAKYAVTSVPTYPTGQIGFILATNDPRIKLEEPTCVFTGEEIKRMQLRYYNGDIHKSAFVLPNFTADVIAQ